jgi:formyl-CoA transferase
MDAALPFAGLKVVELGTVIAGPFAGTLLAELGAEVVKVEPPGTGDAMRQMGARKDGVSIWWGVAVREKRCVALDLKAEADRARFVQLLEGADILVENFRPGVLERLGFGWETLQRINPALILLSITGFGRTGLLSERAGFGKIAEGLSGIVALTGAPDDRPLFVGFSLADTSSGLFGVFGIGVALFQRDLGDGRGVHVDLGLYEPLLRMLDAQFAMPAPTRQGSNDPYGWGQVDPTRPVFRCVRCQEGDWILISVAREAFADLGVASEADATPGALDTWAAALPRAALRDLARQGRIRAVPVMDGAAIAASAYFRARGDVLTATDPVLGELAVPGFVAGRANAEGRTRFRVRAIGEDDAAVLARRLPAS